MCPTKAASGTDPTQARRSFATIAGTETTPWRSAATENSVASTAAAVTRSEARAQRYASSTAGGQCGQVGVTYTSSATSCSSEASVSSDAGESDGVVSPGLGDRADDRGELVSPGQAVVDELAGDGRLRPAARSIGLRHRELDPIGELGQLLEEESRLVAEIDLPSAGEHRHGCLLRA